MTVGHHESAWRFPQTSLTGTWDVAHYRQLARTAERGTFDSAFFEYGLRQLSELIGVPLGEGDLDRRLPPLPRPEAVRGMQSRFASGAADGFNIMPPLLPSGLEEFVDEVVPILRRRGLFRTGYSGRTLREHYGLPRPTNQFTTAPEHAGRAA
jgi:hypothetical protein